MARRFGLAALVALSLLARVAAAQAPAWCKGKAEGRGWPSWESALKDDVYDAIPSIVSCLCDHKCGSSSDDFEKHGREVEEARKKWSQQLEMTDDDWAEAVDWAVNNSGKDYNVRSDNKNLAMSSLDGVEQYSIILNANMGYSDKAMDQNYVADVFGPKLTEIGRLGYILWCISGNSDKGEVQAAMCQGDVDAFDPKKIAAELRADKKHAGVQKFSVRIGMHTARAKIAEHTAMVKALVEKDPAYGQMFKIATETRNQWNGLWRSDAALVELALAMDDARATNSRRAFAGCDEKTWAAFKAAVSSIPAKDFANIETDPMKWKEAPGLQAAQTIVATPKGYLGAMAYFICHSGDEKQEFAVRALSHALIFWPGFRGPRNATQIAIASAGLQLDDRSAKINYPSVHRQWFSEKGFGGSRGGGNGVVKAAKAQGDAVHIEFVTVTQKEPRCAVYKYTHRLTGIDSNGRFTYESACSKEVMVNVDHTSNPVDAKKRYAEGVKPGMKIWATEDSIDVVWPKAGTRIPSFIFGAPVK